MDGVARPKDGAFEYRESYDEWFEGKQMDCVMRIEVTPSQIVLRDVVEWPTTRCGHARCGVCMDFDGLAFSLADRHKNESPTPDGRK
jgi:hypothetical protein